MEKIRLTKQRKKVLEDLKECVEKKILPTRRGGLWNAWCYASHKRNHKDAYVVYWYDKARKLIKAGLVDGLTLTEDNRVVENVKK